MVLVHISKKNPHTVYLSSEVSPWEEVDHRNTSWSGRTLENTSPTGNTKFSTKVLVDVRVLWMGDAVDSVCQKYWRAEGSILH